LDLAIDTTSENLLAQTTNDGVQREWCGGYHTGVYRDALEIDDRATDLGRTMPDYYRKRVRAMADHIFGIATPELAFPMFGDTARARLKSDNRKTWSLYNILIEAGEKFNDPKFKALADLNIKHLPVNGSVAFADAGLYAMRNNWTPDQVYMALHCSPPAISTHDTPDNGTFELYAYGRWLMPDSGFYTYGHDKDARAWHRQTKVHSTMTVNGADTNVIGRQLFWDSKNEQDVLCVENQSYKYFTHRRTVWFAGKNTNLPFFVILDEANGDAKGDLAIHFPMAAGPLNVGDNSFNTTFDDANVLIQVAGKHPISLKEDQGWHAWEYGEREARTSVSAVHSGHGPTVFVSILVPYKGRTNPACSLLTDPKMLIAGNEQAEIQLEVAGKKHTLFRN
ncbi:MAG TPA: alginate lyase family protein, partial [Sphingobacteriaceae bacterium]